MPRKKKSETVLINEIASLAAEETLQATDAQKIIKGNHSTRTEHPDGLIDFDINWDLLEKQVSDAISKHESKKSK